jgi:hypothetical protein
LSANTEIKFTQARFTTEFEYTTLASETLDGTRHNLDRIWNAERAKVTARQMEYLKPRGNFK